MLSTTKVVPFTDTVSAALVFLEGIGSARALSVYILAQQLLLEEYNPDEFATQYKQLGFRVNHYDQFTVEEFRLDYCASVLFSKLPSADAADTTLSSRAVADFQRAEERNFKLNRLWFDGISIFNQLDKLGVSIETIRSTISSILGRAPSLSTVLDQGYWTSGASVSVPRRVSGGAMKSERGTSVTYPLAHAIDGLLKEGHLLNPLITRRDSWVLVPGNLVDTVLKNIEIDRTIAKEPDINAFVQRSIGDSIRKRLRRHGIDLNDQGLNQRACLRAISEKSATLDLKGASNSVLLGAIYQSFPCDWFSLIELSRSPYGSFDTRLEVRSRQAQWFEYSMLSSMGNGFTFELESLLFYAICLACGCNSYETYIYGDDIIIPQNKVSLVTSVLAIFGFELNDQKSFVSGAFFESCGVFSFHGVDVTPIKIKDLFYGPKSVIVFSNKIRMFAYSNRNSCSCDKRFLRSWQDCLRRLPDFIRVNCRGPVGSGLVIYSNRNEMPKVRYSRKRSALLTYQLVQKIKDQEADFNGLFYWKLFLLDSTKHNPDRTLIYGNVIKSTGTDTWVPKPLYIEGDSWCDLGCWT